MPESHDDQFASAVRAASTRADVHATIQSIYDDLARAIDTRRPLCTSSGRCCNFEKYGHRLYITTLEMASFIRNLSDFSPSPSTLGEGRGEGLPQISNHLPILTTPNPCPFQLNNLCSVHPIRPFGCRIFFCDPTATDWQQSQYEIFHTRLKQAHIDLNVPYFYKEWRAALRDLSLMNHAKTPVPTELPL